MTGKRYSATMSLSPELLGQVRERFSDVEPAFRAATGYGFDALTESEARYLAAHRSPESVRSRILAQRDAAQQRLDARGTQEGLNRPLSRALPAPASPSAPDAAAPRGIHIVDAEAIAALIRQANPTGPQIIVLEDVNKAPAGLLEEIQQAGAANDVEGVYYQGAIYLFPQHAASIERFVFVGANHEIRHAGFDALFGNRRGTLMMSISLSNPNIRAAAQRLIDAGHETSMSKAVEEVLAEIPVDQITQLKGWNKVVAAVRQWLRQMAEKLRHNHPRLADMIDPEAGR